MRRIVTAILLSLTLVCLLAPLAFAAEGAAEHSRHGCDAEEPGAHAHGERAGLTACA